MLVRCAIAAAVAAASLTGANCAAPPSEVTFVAWNVRNYRQAEVKDSDGKVTTPAKDPDAVQAVIGTLVSLHPDIIGLSEMGSRGDLEHLQKSLKKAGLDLPHSTWVDGSDKERHLALLSRFPLREARHDTESTFQLGGLPHRVQRGFLDCTVEIVPDFVLHFLGAHFKSRRIVPGFDQAEYRRKESVLLRSRIEDILREAPESRVLLFGDLNDVKNSPSVRGLTGRRGAENALEIVELADKGGDRWTYHWRENDEYSRVDFVMASKELLSLVRKKGSGIYRAREWSVASDHRPLVVKIALPASLTSP